MTTIDATKWAKRNLWTTTGGELCVRPGLRLVYSPAGGYDIVGAFSVRNDYVDEVWTYVAVRDTSTLLVSLLILDENLDTFQQFAWGTAARIRAITHAVVEGQLIIACPDLPTLAGMVGMSVGFALSVPSDNPATTAISVPRGLVASFCNRFVYASERSLFFSDPIAADGGDGRTIVGENQNQRPGIIYGLHEGAGGMLVCVTSEGVYGLDADAAAVQIVGSNGTAWRLLSHLQAHSYESSCVHRGRVYMLTAEGWAPGDTETREQVMLSDPTQPRARGPRIALDDYRLCRMFATAEGPLVAAPEVGAFHRSDLAHDVASWWTDWTGDPGGVIGVAFDHDGTDLLVFRDAIMRITGDYDGEIDLTTADAEDQPIGTLAGVVVAKASSNMLPRKIHVAAAVDGDLALYCAVRGSEHAAEDIEPDEFGIILDVDSFGSTTKRYLPPPLANAEIDFGDISDSNPVRDVGIEVSVEGALVRVLPSLDLTLSASAPARPQAKG